ncbi:MAG TPA: GYD domain-containing protein [Nocardioidaceae bacterium]|nr:GYD domain-containing protein [Nocardioidaceae bacterium]
MAKYLVKVAYSQEGIKGVLSGGGSARVAAVERALSGVGGSLESFYFAFGTDDVYVVADLPSHAAAVAFAGAVTASGAVDKYETVVLLTPAEVDQARDITVDYAPPGS